MDLTAFRYISRFEVAKGVPVTGSISYFALAMKLGLDASQLKRVLRFVMTKQAFTETEMGEVAHTETSLFLLQDGIATMNRYSTNRGFPIAASFNDALEKWGHGSQESNETAFNIFKKSDLAMFDYYEQNPSYASDFHNVMKFFTKTPPLSLDHIKRAFDWSSLSSATVVDVGGSLGHCSLAILDANPSLTCVVQDLPKVVTQATDPKTSIVPDHLKSRITYQPHSFWDPQPLGVEVYFMRMIFHDWPDKYSKKILHALVTGMRPGSRLLIMDYVTVPAGILKPADERRMRIRDLQMMVMHNALERDEGEWRRLLAETDERLRLVAIRTPPGSALSIIEVVLDDEPEVQIVEVVPVLDRASDTVVVEQREPEVKMPATEPLVVSLASLKDTKTIAQVSVVELTADSV